MNSTQNVFTGEHAVRDFMDPGKLAYLPLVEVPPALNPFHTDRVKIFAKLMTFTTLHNVKAIPGFNMLAEAHERGELSSVHTVVENSSGNTVAAIAVAARIFGIDKIKAIVPDEVSVWIGEQIWEQTGGEVQVFCAALGTTGTISGNSQYLKDRNSDLQVVGVMRAPDNYVPGPRTELLLRLVGQDWAPHVDCVTEAQNPESYETSLRLSRQGLFVGPSAGLTMVGLLTYLEARKDSDTLDALRNDEGEVVCVFVCPDTPMPYFDEYFRYVDGSNFPEVTNEELLLNRPGS